MKTLYKQLWLSEVLVVDAYSARILDAFGYHFDSYQALQEWMSDGLLAHLPLIYPLYHKVIPLNELYARFHGKIVEFCKENSKGKVVNVECLGL